MCIMHRAETRYEVREAVPPEVIADGYASTCQTLGYVLRASDACESLRWYTRALQWPARRWIAVKGIVAGAVACVRGTRQPGSPENATANL